MVGGAAKADRLSIVSQKTRQLRCGRMVLRACAYDQLPYGWLEQSPSHIIRIWREQLCISFGQYGASKSFVPLRHNLREHESIAAAGITQLAALVLCPELC